jgi:hypothetical protein
MKHIPGLDDHLGGQTSGAEYTDAQVSAQQNLKPNSLLVKKLKLHFQSRGIDLTGDELLEIYDSLFYHGRAIARYCQLKEEDAS